MSTTGVSAAARVIKKRLKNRRLPTIEVPQVDNPELARSLQGVQEHFRMYEGDSGAPKERFVTMAELEQAGMIRADVKSGFAYISQVLSKDVAQSAGSTANPTLVDPVKKDTSRQSRIPAGGGGGTPSGQRSTASAVKIGAASDVNVSKPAQSEFMYFDGGEWTNFPLFNRANRWRKQQVFDKPFQLLEQAASPEALPNFGFIWTKVGSPTTLWFTSSDGTETQLGQPGGAEVNDLTSTVTWADVPDANVTQSSVTQHQAALSITESQISDLGTYLTDAPSDGTIYGRKDAAWVATVTAGNVRVNTDINTATPPAAEAVTGNFEIYDLADNDKLATIGFNGSTDLEFKSFFESDLGDAFSFTMLDSVTVEHTFMTMSRVTTGLTLYHDNDVKLSTYTGGITIENFSTRAGGILSQTGDGTKSWELGSGAGVGALEIEDSWNNNTVRFYQSISTPGDTLVTRWHPANGFDSLRGFGVFGPGDSANVRLSHDDTDMNIVGTSTTDINVTGITAIQAGTVDADFDALSATSLTADGSIVLTDGASESVTMAYSGTDFLWLQTGGLTQFDGGTPVFGDFANAFTQGVEIRSATGESQSLQFYEGVTTEGFDLRNDGANSVFEISTVVSGVRTPVITIAQFDGDTTFVGDIALGDHLSLDGKEALDGNDAFLRLNQNGDFSAGLYTPGATRLDGTLQVGAAAPFTVNASGDIVGAEIRLTNTGDAGLGTDTHAFQVGLTASTNLIMDGNELMARDNGSASGLHVNADGGDITLGNNGGGNSSFYVRERASSGSDTAGMGQIWFLNNSPNEMWFTDDEGNDHIVAGGQLTENYGVLKTSNEGVFNTTLQNDDELVLPVLANQTYNVKIWLKINQSDLGPGFKWDFAVPSGSAGFYKWQKWTGAGAGPAAEDLVSDWTADQSFSVIQANSVVIIDGTFTCGGTGGNLQFRFAQNSSSAEEVQVESGSSMTTMRIA